MVAYGEGERGRLEWVEKLLKDCEESRKGKERGDIDREEKVMDIFYAWVTG